MTDAGAAEAVGAARAEASVPRLAPGLIWSDPEEAEDTVILLPPGRYFRVSRPAGRLLGSIDGRRDLSGLAACLSRDLGRSVSEREVRTVLEERLVPAGLVELGGTASSPAPARASRVRGRVTLLPAGLVRAAALALSPCFRPPLLVLLAAIAFCAPFLWLLPQPTGAESGPILRVQVWLPALLWIHLALLAHELAHAGALRSFGRLPGEIGAGFFRGRLVFFAQVAQAFLLPARKRVVVDLAGACFQALAGGLLLLAGWMGVPSALAAGPFVYLGALACLRPERGMDGDWLLQDLPTAGGRRAFRTTLAAATIGWLGWFALAALPRLLAEGRERFEAAADAARAGRLVSMSFVEPASGLGVGLLVVLVAAGGCLGILWSLLRPRGLRPQGEPARPAE